MSDLSALARLRLVGELRKQRALAATATSALQKLKIAKSIRDIRTQLGLGAAEPKPEPGPAPLPPAITPDDAPDDAPELARLREVADGKRDNADLEETFDLIERAVLALDKAGALVGDAETVAHAAITRWAEIDERVNG